MNLKQLVREALDNKDCCTATKPTKAPILNESLAPREILSEGLKYHIDNKKPLTEHVYRAGSTNYFNLWAEARALYVRGILDFSGDDLDILTETQLGNFGIYEGKKVPLDFIMEEIEFPFEYKGFQYSVEDTGGMVNDRGQKVWKVAIQDKNGNVETTTVRGSSDREGHYEAKKFIEDELLPYYGLDEIKLTGAGVMDVIRRVSKDAKLLDFLNFNTLKDFLAFIKTGSLDDYYEVMDDIKRYDQQLAEGLDEAKKKPKKKNPPIGKPMRGGSKKFYVYVKAPGGKIKKVSFGQAGMSAKINNPEARRAFAARHDCKNKKDRTKASYWSCRLPRYAKLLGLKSNFSGFW